MKITVCIGSSCHLKGSKKVAQTFEKLISENNLREKINFHAAFCMGNCQNGVCVTMDDQTFSLTPETTRDFFEKDVLPRL